MQSVIRSLLRLRLALSRFGTGTLLAAALLAAAALLWLGVLPGMSARVADETRSVARLRAQPVPKPVVPAPVLAAGRLADFYAGLGDSAHTGEIVMRLFDAAAAAGVTLDKAEYKPGHDAPGRFDTYTIVLPVKGDYARLRQFSEKVLVTVPYAALDDMRFQRNSANDPGVEANLRFTAFLRPVTIAPVSASAVAAAAANASAAAVAAAASGASATAVATSGAPGAAVAVAAASGVSTRAAAAVAAASGAPTRAAVTATASPGASMAAVTIAALPLAAPAVVVSAVPLPTTAAATLAHTSAAQLKSGLPQPHKPSPASAPASPATARSASAPSAATPQKIAASQGATR